MIETFTTSVFEAHELEEMIVDAVFNYVSGDDTRSGFGINAAFRASIALSKCSTMSDETRMALAQSMFMEMTEDLNLSAMKKLGSSSAH